MAHSTLRFLLGAILFGTAAWPLHAQMSTDPLLSHTASVESNIVLMFDDSPSMQDNFLYQYGGSSGVNGMSGPSGSYSSKSPDVNLLYYDPRKTYSPSIKANGTFNNLGTTSNSFNVYFFNPGTLNTYGIASANVNAHGGGYPASGVIATFGPPQTPGGTQATVGSVSMTPYQNVTSVTMTNRGGGYPASGAGVTATFSAPPAGGTVATGTPVISSSSNVSAVAVANGGSGYPTAAGAVTITFPSPPAGGVSATGTVTVTPGKYVKSVTLTPAAGPCGNGYPSNTTVTFSAPPAGAAGRVTATGTVNLTGNGGNRKIASVTIVNPGAAYTTAPTVTFSAPGSTSCVATAVLSNADEITKVTVTNGGAGYASTPAMLGPFAATGSGATFSVIMGTTNVISGVTITNAGAGYTSAPTVSFASTGTGSGASGTVNTGTSYGISGITVGNAGSGYTSAPLITFTAVTGAGGLANAVLSAAPTGTIGGNKKWSGTPTAPANSDFFTPSYIPDAGSPLASGANATLVYPNTSNSTTTNYPKFRNRTDCGATSCSWAQEQQNYANWSAYHSTRLKLATTGIGLAFQGLNPTFRLGWGTINKIDNNNQLDAGVRLYDNTTQSAFFTWLYGISTTGMTPSRSAFNKVGSYFSRVDDSGPWANSPPIGTASTASPGGTEVLTHASCRRSYALLMTDGYYNDTFTLVDQDTTTQPAVSTPSGGTYQYTPTGPYSDTANGTKIANTMADVAMKYWVTDLRPNIANNVRPTSTDLAFWQHLNFYAIDLGLIGTAPYDSNNPSVLAALTGNSPTRTLNWLSPSTNNPTAIDDMWHATINARGTISTASNAADLRDAIGHMLTDVSGATGDQAGVAVSTGIEYSDSTNKFTPEYDRSNWTGLLASKNVASDAAVWQVETKCADGPNPPNASSRCPIAEKPYIDLIPSATCAGAYGAGCRNIYVGNSGSPRAVPFTYAGMGSLTSAMTATTNIPVNSALINYLRGDYANEKLSINSAVASATYRVRANKLGDIVNSSPVYIGGGFDELYDQLPVGTAGKSTYPAFRTSKTAAAEGLLFVGANDGMLHAFRNGVGSSQAGGIETFAYIPKALLPTLNQLADPLYVHRYYVDGPLVQTDAYAATPAVSASGWASIVVGSTGDGAGVASGNGTSPRSAVFAIETTSVFSQGITDSSNVPYMNASSVLWEVSSDASDFSELGYMLHKVQTGTTTDGSWIAVFGNGYESASCKAQLFVVNLANGALIKKIDTGVGGGNCTLSSNANRNGLGGVTLVRNDKQQVIGAYAGDLQGNLWKFNLTGSSSAWGVDLGGAPLFTATSAKPITEAPAVIALPVTTVPVTSPDYGYMVVFGTGKFFEVGDLTTTSTQSMYGIWDTAAFGAASYPGVALTTNGLLVQQTEADVVINGKPSRTLTANVVCYISDVSKCPPAPAYTTAVVPNRRGWQIDLPHAGERLIYPVKVLEPHHAYVQPISPIGVSSQDPCNAVAAGSSLPFNFDPLSGAHLNYAIIDTNSDGVIDANDRSDVVSQGTGSATSENQLLNNKDVTGCTSVQYDIKPTCAPNQKLTAHPIKTMVVNGMTVGTEMICSVTYTCDSSGVRKQTREWRQLFMR